MKGSQRRPFVPLLKPPHKLKYSRSVPGKTHRCTHTPLLTSCCLATSQHAWLWQAEVSALKCDASWGIACAAPYITHGPPLLRQLQSGFVFAADVGKVSQRTTMARRRSFRFSVWGAFGASVDVKLTVTLGTDALYILRCAIGAFHLSDLFSPSWSDPWPLFCRWASLRSCEGVELNLLLRTHYCELDFTGCR